MERNGMEWNGMQCSAFCYVARGAMSCGAGRFVLSRAVLVRAATSPLSRVARRRRALVVVVVAVAVAVVVVSSTCVGRGQVLIHNLVAALATPRGGEGGDDGGPRDPPGGEGEGEGNGGEGEGEGAAAEPAASLVAYEPQDDFLKVVEDDRS